MFPYDLSQENKQFIAFLLAVYRIVQPEPVDIKPQQYEPCIPVRVNHAPRLCKHLAPVV